MKGIEKSFPGIHALRGVDLELFPGEVHVLLGENGAGKSTLMKVLAGVYQADSGGIEMEGRPVRPRSTLEARGLGVVMVMQEFNLIPDLSVAENLVLINRPEGRLSGLVNKKNMEAKARDILERLGINVAPGRVVRRLSVAEKQLVEIAKAAGLSARVLVLDEPTAALSEAEVGRLFRLIRDLKARGAAIVYISHRFEEIYEIGDRVTVLRDGERVGSHLIDSVGERELICEMAGRELADLYPRRRVAPGEEALAVRGISVGDEVKSVSFTLRRGEILGLGGLMGAGRTALAKAIIGAVFAREGEVSVFGRRAWFSSPRAALEAGVAYLTEDRKDEGLFLGKSLAWNLSISDLAGVVRRGIIDFQAEKERAREYIGKLRISPPDPDKAAGTFSGGGQQKILLARWLASGPGILILDEPTRGVDVGAKAEIYSIMDGFVGQGGAVLLISSDLPELLAMSDRIAVMREGAIQGELEFGRFDQERVVAMAAGVDPSSISD